MDKLEYIHTMGYYTAVEINKLYLSNNIFVFIFVSNNINDSHMVENKPDREYILYDSIDYKVQQWHLNLSC